MANSQCNAARFAAKRYRRLLLGLCLLAGSAQAAEFSVQPNPASAGQTVNVVMSDLWGWCSLPQLLSVGTMGSVVTVTVTYATECIGTPIPISGGAIPIGKFAAGTYTLRLVGVESTLAEIPFNVVAGAQQAVGAPVGSGLALLALGASLMLFAGWRLRSSI